MNARDFTRTKIKELRLEKKLTQAKMAELLHMSENGYAKIERGECGVGQERLIQIAKVLEVSPTQLVPTETDACIVFNNSNDNFSNSSNFNLLFGEKNLSEKLIVLQNQVENLNQIINSKDDVIAAKNVIIEKLEKQCAFLESMLGQKQE
ncbi:helix-turn-helix transcriptional regulator [Pasteurellaceae bacterium HPA106]|uniref:helix-turn-helix domain-containing protein n=1 Tax=Spirabiliibacterium pneumoniae TaxID=221400 RepID=UPI001AADE814|nr:helix-turn-helix transcriptional regulator [Spirabiliibacterium pneumoniae]MBE2895694.1 helix-turn-helix transcriptional regulator [Spirabiliibacterium pneumoniae]